MPLYDYRCPCGHLENDSYRSMENNCPPCPTCGEVLHPVLGTTAMHTFHEGYYPQLTGKDKIYFTSKRQLRDESRKRGKYSDYAEG